MTFLFVWFQVHANVLTVEAPVVDAFIGLFFYDGANQVFSCIWSDQQAATDGGNEAKRMCGVSELYVLFFF